MYSKGSDYDYRRQDSDRNSRRKWDDYDDRREKRRDFHSNSSRDSYYKQRRDGHDRTDRLSRSRDYSDSPKRLCSSDSVSRDWSRKSPARRRLSPPGWDVPEGKRRRNTEEDDRDYRYQRDYSGKTQKLSPASFSRNQQSRYSPPCEDVRWRKTSPYSRSRHQREELPLQKAYEDFDHRDASDYFKASAHQERRHGYSQERSHSPDHTVKIQDNTRQRISSPSTSVYYDEYYENRTSAPQNGSHTQFFKSDAHPQSAGDPEQRSSKGFQRFLDVLNKGVNVDVLTQIVSQNPTPLCDGRVSSGSFGNVADEKWSAGRQQKHNEDDDYWNKSQGSRTVTTSQPRRRSASPNRNPAFVRESFVGSQSPSGEKMTMTPEDQQKHKQMQDVLLAIGLDLGSEELGQMSHRIHERLYGKKDNERGRRLSRERSVGQAFTAGRQSRSSSSRSVTPPLQSSYSRKDSFSDMRDGADVQQSKFSLELNRKSFHDGQDIKENKIGFVQSTAAVNALPLNPMNAVNKLPPALMPPAPAYSPISHLPPLYQSTVPPPLLPFVPRVGPGNVFPRVPPMLPHSPLPPPNVFPALLAQRRPSVPPHLQLLNQTAVNAQQAMNAAEQSKTQERHRFLQVIK